MINTMRIIAHTVAYLWLRLRRKGLRSFHASLHMVVRHQKRRLA